MFRRIAVVAVLVGGGLAFAPAGASATPLCEMVAYDGVTTLGPAEACVPYSGDVFCSSGSLALGVLGTVPHEVCVPSN